MIKRDRKCAAFRQRHCLRSSFGPLCPPSLVFWAYGGEHPRDDKCRRRNFIRVSRLAVPPDGTTGRDRSPSLLRTGRCLSSVIINSGVVTGNGAPSPLAGWLTGCKPLFFGSRRRVLCAAFWRVSEARAGIVYVPVTL